MAAADVAAMRYIAAEDRFRSEEATERAQGNDAKAEGAKWYAEWCHRAAVNELQPEVTKPDVLCVGPHDMRLAPGGTACFRCDYRVKDAR
jgi:hypothetical protein